MILRVAIDIDGVLADQVGAALNRIEEEYGQRYLRENVDCAHWNFSGKDIWSEIARLLSDREYVLSVPTIEGARESIAWLAEQAQYEIFVVTARRPNTERATREWLKGHFPALTEYYYARTGSKQEIPSDVLVDDFDLNVVEFVKSSPSRTGILFMQPWSRNGLDLEMYSDRIHICREWKSVTDVLARIDRDAMSV